MSYATLKKVAIGSLGLYVLLAWAAHFFAPTENMYPVFSWNLFSTIPNEVHTYTLAILSYDGERYNPPLAFDNSLFLLKEARLSPSQYTWTIVHLGDAVKSNDTEAIEYNRRIVEGIFSGRPARYEVRYAVYNPLEHWKTGAFTHLETVATFSANTP